MKKVAFLICSETIGGHEFQSMEFVRSCSAYCETTVILNNKEQLPLMDSLKDIKVNHVIFDAPFFKGRNFILQFIYGIINFFKIRFLLKQYDHIIVCAGTIEAGISTGIALVGGNIGLYVPMFVDRTKIWGKPGYIYNMISILFILPFKNIVTINRFQARYFSRFKKVFIIPNRVELPSVKLTRSLKKGRLYFIGRLEKQKRIPELINWLDHPENCFRELILIGDGSEKETILALEKKLKYISLNLTGWLTKSEQTELLTDQDVFIINSAYEGDPLVIREANERGSIVIASNITGHRACTFKQNRYNTQEELLQLLTLASNRSLKKFVNQSDVEIEKIRDHVTKQIFV